MKTSFLHDHNKKLRESSGLWSSIEQHRADLSKDTLIDAPSGPEGLSRDPGNYIEPIQHMLS